MIHSYKTRRTTLATIKLWLRITGLKRINFFSYCLDFFG